MQKHNSIIAVNSKRRINAQWPDFWLLLISVFGRLPFIQRLHVIASMAVILGTFCTLGWVGIVLLNTQPTYTTKVVMLTPASSAVNTAEKQIFESVQQNSEPITPIEIVPLVDQPKVIESPLAPQEPKKEAKVEISVKQYISRYAPTAKKVGAKYNVPPSVILGQGIIEGKYGNSSLVREANNHFGHKCFSKNCKKGHCVNKTDDTHKDFFKVYKSAWEAYDAHARKISSGRYKNLKHSQSYKDWASGLAKAGYATDKTYAQKLRSTIEQYKLYQYDDWFSTVSSTRRDHPNIVEYFL